MRIRLFILFSFSISFIFGQNVEILKPIVGEENNYTESQSDYWKNAIDSLALSDDSKNNINYSDMTEKTKKAIDSLEMFFGPLTQTVACSWYCGGGPYKVTSSSILDHNETYSHNNIHDFDLLTGWVPIEEYGIGEYISFHFKPKSPRINAVIIYNGYLKTNALWKNNARAKKIELKIDNQIIAILELEDTTASQRFEFNPVESKNENEDLILTLSILDSYPGNKYSDLVISEINFDGLDVH